MTIPAINSGIARIWKDIDGDPSRIERVSIARPEPHLPSVYDVSGFATAIVAAANLAVAELLSLRSADPASPGIEIDGLESVAAFRSEALVQPKGWEIPAPWDPIAGDYPTRDGWIRIHTNYEHHRVAALSALSVAQADRGQVAEAIARRTSIELEEAVVRHGGCAAAMLDEEQWAASPPGAATAQERIVRLEPGHSARPSVPRYAKDAPPLHGIRVLDLTRVLAGPECTRFLAAWGAQVLRIDPPGFQEVAALLPDVTVGKLRAFLDLRDPTDRRHFEGLVRQAHVLVTSYRPDALTRLGLPVEVLYDLNPSLLVARLSAYGWSGPLASRRGFDSLVQMTTGIAARGMHVLSANAPRPLPAQALDHGAGFALAAGVCQGLHRLWNRGENSTVSASLVGASNLLRSDFRAEARSGSASDFSETLFPDHSYWGPLRRARSPGVIGGKRGSWSIPAGPLGTDPPVFTQENP